MDGETRPCSVKTEEEEKLLEELAKLQLPDVADKAKAKEDFKDESAEGDDKFHDCEEDIVENAENDDGGEDEEFSEASEILLDDFVDEVHLKEEQDLLTEEQLQELLAEAKVLKEEGNVAFKEEKIEDSIKSYTRALFKCPLGEKEFRCVLYSNRAAAKIKMGNNKESAVMDCTKSLEYNDTFMKSYIRRAKLYEEMDKLDEALADYQKIYEMDPSNSEALAATKRLPPIIHERNEKLKAEMMGKLKDLGNMILRPFGLSTNNFQLQPTESGGYTVNFQQ